MLGVMLCCSPDNVDKIGNGEKTIDLRKTKPKLTTPFKCFLYCSKPSYDHEDFLVFNAGTENCKAYYCGGRVIGEFVCDQIYDCDADSVGLFDRKTKEYLPGSCMSFSQICTYTKGVLPLYGWHISELIVYDEPKPLDSFKHWIDTGMWSRLVPLEKAPKSWCYIEEAKF